MENQNERPVNWLILVIALVMMIAFTMYVQVHAADLEQLSREDYNGSVSGGYGGGGGSFPSIRLEHIALGAIIFGG